jgi:uncharacterized protein (TIGR00730 family)
MPTMKNLCVYCGASHGSNPAFTHAATVLGEVIARRNLTLVFGGGSVGLMGAVADSTLHHGGKAIGVITELLRDKELAHARLTRLDVVRTMHERKLAMADLADAFVVLPGGYGTLDEMFEIIAWAQLGIHSKPIALLNTHRFFDRLMEFLDHAGDLGFLRLDHRSQIILEEDPEALVARLQRPQPAPVARFPGLGPTPGRA